MSCSMAEKPEFSAFPYKPYSIQIDFMNALYQFLDKGGVSMLESPTGTHISGQFTHWISSIVLLFDLCKWVMSGTGKSLSIICSALQWLIDRKEKANPGFTEETHKVDDKDCDEPDWMRNFTVNSNYKANDDKTIKNSKSPFPLRKHAKERVAQVEGKLEAELNDQEFLLDDYESQEESSPGGGYSKRKPTGGFESSSEEEEDENEGSVDEQGLKVFFCSRTHSQLSQFVKELRKTVFAEQLKVVCLGSRKNLCINQGVPPFLLILSHSLPHTYLRLLWSCTDVLKLGNVARINERCLDLQKKKKTQVSKKKVHIIYLFNDDFPIKPCSILYC